MTWTASVLSGLASLAAAAPTCAQAPAEVQAAFVQWAGKSLHPFKSSDLGASTQDLRPLERMIGDAKIVGLSEGIHAAAEPLIFRNRVFKHLVEQMGFRTIALESGIVESRVLNDYVTQGKGDLDAVLRQGLSNGFETFRQNGELIRWMRDYNTRLPPHAPRLQIFGLDVPGSPGNFDAARGPDTALRYVLDYLRMADPEAAEQMRSRVEAYLPVLKDINGYGDLKPPERDALTAVTADLVSLMERQQFAYVAKTSRDDFAWAERAAIGARQTDSWFRRMPPGWKLEDGLAWTQYAMQVRDRTMADNLEWVRSRLGPRERVLVFAASGHLASTVVQLPHQPAREMIPMGTYLKDRYGSDFINLLSLVANGEITYCSARPRRQMPLKPPPGSSVENLFAAVNEPRYFLDLRRAPAGVSTWLHQVRDHWNGFVPVQFATAGAFDLLYYVSPVTSACADET